MSTIGTKQTSVCVSSMFALEVRRAHARPRSGQGNFLDYANTPQARWLISDIVNAENDHVRFGSKANMCSAQADIRLVPIADIHAAEITGGIRY